MAHFDFIECTSHAYRFLWNNRQDVSRVIAPVILLKILSFMGVTALSLDNNILRQGLLLLPSHALEGFVLAGLIPWAMGIGLSDIPKTRMQAVAGVYVFLKLVMSFAMGLIFSGQALQAPPPSSEPAGLVVWLIVGGMLAGTLWGFRLLWLYVPVALGYQMRAYLKALKGWRASYDMIGLWILCFVPWVLAMIVVSEIVAFVVPGAHGDSPSALFAQILAMLQACVDTLITMVASIGMAYGIDQVMKKKENI